ncbi:MAG TPA: amylo-alpha-1,6-glucosidase [Blastocatellia bacterium]|nr:amylo-alpha-1,6-glucosidase [Blastocatellia bacterium]
MIQFHGDAVRNLESASKREWLETNGLGGFASSTITGLNTRRYHGLLVAATKPPVGRLVLLAKLEETLIIDGRRYELSVNQYPEVIHPQGHLCLKQFRLDPYPILTYEVEGVEIEKSVFMIHGENSTAIRYDVRAGDDRASVLLEVRPLVAFRDYHGTTRENSAINHEIQLERGRIGFAAYQGLPTLHFAHDADDIDPAGFWFRNFEYAVERERGLDFSEDLYSPLAFKFDMSRRSRAAIIASTEKRDAGRIEEYQRAEIGRRADVVSASPHGDELVRWLVAAADQYIVARERCKTVIAGYHWFGDWGRDTMIALAGLTLVTGRTRIAKSILLEFAQHIDRGMLPNRFPDAGEAPEYNTVDATLWYFEAIRALGEYTGDYEFIKTSLYPALVDIIDWHERGTRYGIKVDDDGLLLSGEPGVQLTWMDAKVGDYVVTPRDGKAVEIQALWYNALRVMEEFASKFGDRANRKRFGEMASRARRSFENQFWNEEAGCLCDSVKDAVRDASIRPNQILAVSLKHSMLTRDKAKRVVDVIERELLTPYGLRSLARSDPAYRPRYEGGVWDRDTAYHQGTVWPWLMGPFITAYVRANGNTKRARERAKELLVPLVEHLSDAGLGHVSEILDADSPHEPRGCVAQAWSVAEILRAAVEDVFAVKPAPKRLKAVRSAAT